MEDAWQTEADKEAATRRELGPQVLEDAERLIADWNGRQAERAPMLFSPTIGAAIAARHWQSTCARSTVIPTQRSQA